MRRLQLQNSAWGLIGLLIIVLVACKAKKQHKQDDGVLVTESASDEAMNEDTIQDNKTVIIHKPGTINQDELDSVKAAQRLLKRKKVYKK